MAYTRFEKDPQALLDYSVNWTTWLGSDTILTSTFVVAPPGELLISSDSVDATNKIAMVWLEGGVRPKVYLVTNHVTTAGGRADDHSFQIKMVEK